MCSLLLRLRGHCWRAEISCRNCRIHPSLRSIITLMLQHLPGLVQGQYTLFCGKGGMSCLSEYYSRYQSENWRGTSCSFLKEAVQCLSLPQRQWLCWQLGVLLLSTQLIQETCNQALLTSHLGPSRLMNQTHGKDLSVFGIVGRSQVAHRWLVSGESTGEKLYASCSNDSEMQPGG